MVQVGVALIATLVSLVGTGAMLSRAFDRRRPHLFAWALTQFGLCAGLGATAVGLLVGFGEPLFRTAEIGGALIAPLWLAMGVVELVTRPFPVKFAARLVIVSYTIVAVVILALDPLRGDFTSTLPKPDDHYEWLPLAVIAGAHLIAVTTLVICAAVTAARARDIGPAAPNVLVPVALVALAGVLIVSGTRAYLPAAAAVFAMGAAAALIWFGAIKTVPASPEHADDYDEYEYGDGYEPVYDERPRGDRAAQGGRGAHGAHGDRVAFAAEDGGPRHRRGAAEPLPDPMAGAPLAAPIPPIGSMPPGVPPPGQAVPGGGAQPYAGPLPSQPPVAAQIPPGAYGQITVYTLLDGREGAFDRLSRETVSATQQGEPGTLIYACHEVVGAPTQRIFYQLFRDRAAFEEHQRRPYVRQFLADSRSHVIATNVIELRLDTAKVVPMAPPTGPELQMGRPWGP
ncbi:MAG TPA: antibiotic biosynthesis monooxygenase [Streptosporangiaceae bacterium]|nr:antibiotic biosynthesis monooxygenase [Streptosporangiaceae bacterium]